MIRKLFLICFVVSVFFSKFIFAGEINPIKELFQWTVEQQVGTTIVWGKSDKQWTAGANWDIFKSKHDWLRCGLLVSGIGSAEPMIGGQINFNVGKVIEKIKGLPMVYLKHLEVGAWKGISIYGNRKDDAGLFINVIKIEF